jgi:type 1 glutamine amidotransferase
MRNFIIAIFLCTLQHFSLAQPIKKLIRILIVDGYSNHNWQQTTAITKKILEESKLFEVSVTTAPATANEDSLNAWDPDFNRYDVVIQNTNNIQNKALHWPRKAEKKLEDYVARGGGLYILHSGNNAFPHWKEYDEMIGLGWRVKETGFALEIDNNKKIIRIPPGEGYGTNHGNRFDAMIQILNRHPINHDFPEQWRTASMELYTYTRGPAKDITVLSYAFDSATQKNWPVDWVVKYKKGRVYNSSMGHLWKGETYPISYRCIGFQTTMIRAAEWLAKGKVTYRLPATFPNDNISMRAETDYPGGFMPIFDGKTLNNWEGDTTYWRVEDGCLTGVVTPETLLKRNSFIIWQGTMPDNFEIRLQYKISAKGNSGINYRSERVEGVPNALRGYQADINGANTYTGSNYEERKRTTLASQGEQTVLPPVQDSLQANIRSNQWAPKQVIASLGSTAELRAVIKTDDWNECKIVANGNHLQHYINGVLMSDVTDNDKVNRRFSGLLGVQVHVGPPMKVAFRNIRVKAL